MSDNKKSPNDTTVDSLSGGTVPSNLTESSTALEETILINVQKIKHYVGMFMYLAELSEGTDIPSMLEVMRSKRQQLKAKVHLLGRVEDQEKLREFDEYLPELDLWKNLRLAQWRHYQERYNLADHTNLAEVATFLTSQSYPVVSGVFRGRPDLRVDLLMHYQARLDQ